MTKGVTFGSVCSGIEAASCAWDPLDWRADWFAEIESFPAALLAERFPEISNLGDMTKIADMVQSGAVSAPDVLVGGTPCQAYSIAGTRKGLADDRGLLTLKYIELADEIDRKRAESGHQPAVIVWENVPGVLSMPDNAFGHFIAGLAGGDEAAEPGNRPEHGKSNLFWRWNEKTGCHVPKWTNAGCVNGPVRQVAWRVLDAQYFGVAQRRRRIFVVASADKRISPVKILFEFDSLRRDIAPRRDTGENITSVPGGSITVRCGESASVELQRAFRLVSFGEYKEDGTASTCKARDYKDATDLAICMNPALTHGIPGYWIGRKANHGGNSVNPMINLSPCLTTMDRHGVAYADQSGEVPVLVARRLVPVECERLQGFPDNWTQISWRDKEASQCPDSPRYKAIGNSMAVPVMRWIGQRIAEHLPRPEAGGRDGTDHFVDVNNKVVAQPVNTGSGRVKPFLKWVGGKFTQLDDILPLLQGHQRLIEPFAGGGSIFLNAGLKTALVNDNCSDLINTYRQLQKNPHAVIDKVAGMFARHNNQADYLTIRERFNQHEYTDQERAAVFVYLNRHCFNGLVRYNQKGQFNVGFGKYDAPYLPVDELQHFASIAGGLTFSCGDYSDVIEQAGPGDVLFCDPPYEPLPGKDGFTQYSNAGAFRLSDQIRLADLAVEAHQRGSTVIITNSGADSLRDAYSARGFAVSSVSVKRSMSSRSGARKRASDIIAILRGSH